MSTLAGSGVNGFADGPGTTAQFNGPHALAVDGLGNVYVGDTFNHRVRKIDSLGVVSTLAGSGVIGFADGPAATAQFSYPTGVAVDASGNVYVSEESSYGADALVFATLNVMANIHRFCLRLIRLLGVNCRRSTARSSMQGGWLIGTRFMVTDLVLHPSRKLTRLLTVAIRLVTFTKQCSFRGLIPRVSRRFVCIPRVI